MFAPKVAKPHTKTAENPTSEMAPQRSTIGGRRLGRDPVEQEKRAMLPLFLQQKWRPAVSTPPGDYEQEGGAAFDPGPAPLRSRHYAAHGARVPAASRHLAFAANDREPGRCSALEPVIPGPLPHSGEAYRQRARRQIRAGGGPGWQSR
jgi:hypothetical protein